MGLLRGGRRGGRGRAAAMTPTRREFYDTNVAYYWAHLVMLLGIVCIAAGLERAIGHAFDSLSFARALELGGGTALYLAGHAFFRAGAEPPVQALARGRAGAGAGDDPARHGDLGAGSAGRAGRRARAASSPEAASPRRPPGAAHRPDCVPRTWPRRAPHRRRRTRGRIRIRRLGREAETPKLIVSSDPSPTVSAATAGSEVLGDLARLLECQRRATAPGTPRRRPGRRGRRRAGACAAGRRRR